MINIIFWDVDGTLLNFLAAESAAVKGLFLKFGFGECSDEMIAEYSQINKKYWKQIEKGEITKEEALRARFVEFFASHGLPVAAAMFRRKSSTRNIRCASAIRWRIATTASKSCVRSAVK